MNSVLVFQPIPTALSTLKTDLEAAGARVLAVLGTGSNLVQAVVRDAPDLVIADIAQADAAFLDSLKTLAGIAPAAVLVFTQDSDATRMDAALQAGVNAYVVQGYGAPRLRPLMQLALSRFKRDQALRQELRDLSERFEERKDVERAKGILMSARAISDDAAFEILRSASMHSQQRLGQVAAHIIQSARSAESLNRAGQLRMLSQRLVKLWLLRLSGVMAGQHQALFDASLKRIDDNLALLARQLSQPTFGDLLARVQTTWKALKKTLKPEPAPERLHSINALAERLLQDAERLTASLESAGGVAPLKVLNMAGRQRMLSQRFAKLALLATFSSDAPSPTDPLAEMVETSQAFEQGLMHLNSLPLSTPEIRRTLESAAEGWQALRSGADQVRRPAGRDRLLRLEGLAGASETLLDDFENLAAQYERSMQMLMG